MISGMTAIKTIYMFKKCYMYILYMSFFSSLSLSSFIFLFVILFINLSTYLSLSVLLIHLLHPKYITSIVYQFRPSVFMEVYKEARIKPTSIQVSNKRMGRGGVEYNAIPPRPQTAHLITIKHFIVKNR